MHNDRFPVEVPMKFHPVAAALILALMVAAAPARAQQVTSETVDGVADFKRLQTTVACAGDTKPTAVAAVKKMGYASIINLRLADEEGADLNAEAAAAKQ